MNQSELDAEVQRLFECAKIDLKKEGTLMPVVLADCAMLPQRIAIPLPWHNEQEQAEICTRTIKFLKQQNCTVYFLIAEVWSKAKHPTTQDEITVSTIVIHAETCTGLSASMLGAVMPDDTVQQMQIDENCPLSTLLDVFGGNNAVH